MNKCLGNTVIMHRDENISLCFGRRVCASLIMEEGSLRKISSYVVKDPILGILITAFETM